MKFSTELYTEQVKRWPTSGRHILAHFDERSIIVYQAYRPSIGLYAAQYGRFGGDFSFSRMSWIKPNFLWMMYRSGWGTKKDQEITLGLRIRREFFDSLLAQAVPSSWVRELYATPEEWEQAVAKSSVRVQWDPDHNPAGAKLERRAIQLGLRGASLDAFGTSELLEVINLTEFVAEQRELLQTTGVKTLMTPTERVYVPASRDVAKHIGIESET